MNKLSSIEIVTAITPHNNADLLELAHVAGYTCIVGKGDFAVGSAVVLIQPDTVLPDKPWGEMFRKKSNRVRATKLRGIWSFGIVMSPYTVIENSADLMSCLIPTNIGKDISELIGVTKYEPPIPQCLDAMGNLPYGLGKTDETRWNNLIDVLPFGKLTDITLKYDGKSSTFYCSKNPHTSEWETGICSRSLRMKPECSNDYTIIEAKYKILEKLKAYCIDNDVSLALRGEIYGKGIQAFAQNPHAKFPLSFAAFSVYNMDTRNYEGPDSEFYYEKICDKLGIPVVQMLEKQVIFTQEIIEKYSVGINTINGMPFEGVVCKYSSGSFKIINMDYDSRK